MNEHPSQPTIGALRLLGDRFESLERARPARGPQKRIGQIATAVALALILVAAALSPPGRAVAGKLGEFVGIDTPTPPPQRQAHPGVETHLEIPTPALVDTCEERLGAAPHDQLCTTVMLLNEGLLEPGDYTNEEFDKAFKAALALRADHPEP